MSDGKGLDLKISSVPEGKLVVLDMDGRSGGAFRLVAVYTPIDAG